MILKCEICGSTAINDETVSEVFHVNGQYQLVENIPASVCAQCGETTFSRVGWADGFIVCPRETSSHFNRITIKKIRLALFGT